jgi:hypothetical protein
MSQQKLNLGVGANDGTGDTLRSAGEKINDNFEEVYYLLSLGGGGGDVDMDAIRALIDQEIQEQLENLNITDGANSANILLYKSFSADVLPSEEDIDFSTVFTFETGSLTKVDDTDLDFKGWQTEAPSISSGRFVFLIQAILISTEDSITLEPSRWSTPVLVFDRGFEDLDVNIISSNGNVFREDQGQTELKANIIADGESLPSNDYSNFNYEWSDGENPVCVNLSTREVSHLNGEVVTSTDGVCPVGFGVPAKSSSDSFSNGELRSIFIDAQAVPNQGTLNLQLTITDKIQED